MASTLASQFKQLQKQNQQRSQQVHREAVELMTLEDLSMEKIAFGEAKKGVLFKEAMKDTKWTEFFLSRYENSEKPEHMMFVKYVSLEMEKQCKEAPKPKNSTKGYKSETPSTAMPVTTPMGDWHALEEEEFDWMHYAVKEEMKDLRGANQQLSLRMGQVENVMQEVLQHLRKLDMVKSEPSPWVILRQTISAIEFLQR